MSITIQLSPDLEEQLRTKAAREGISEEVAAKQLLRDALEWEAQDFAEAVEGIRRGLEACDEGRFRPAADVFAKYQAALDAARK